MKSKIRNIAMIIIALALAIFFIVIMIFRNSLSELGKDPSVNFLNLDASYRTAQIINLNKNRNGEDCWNQMNPHIDCVENGAIVEGSYILRGIDQKWLEKAENFELDSDYVRAVLHGFKEIDRTYNQKIHITYPDENEMHVSLETWNDRGEKEQLEITLTK
ncbi:hypothetical protein ACFL3T_02425 [Patescibacteria group bacterium]